MSGDYADKCPPEEQVWPQKVCPQCGGVGEELWPGPMLLECPMCHGEGTIDMTPEDVEGLAKEGIDRDVDEYVAKTRGGITL